MEKIININMAGQVIAIEDSAYTSLKAYVESLYNLFSNEDGRDEIINDIESRIAELMSEKIRHGSVAITEADIQEIINSMGRVEDFAASEEESQQGQKTNTGRPGSGPKGQRRFRRDSNDKIAGGVCAGIAAYLNVDPALVRIVFAILTLGGWGSGLLLYIALWILVPASDMDPYRGRRLFRSQEDKWLGGVCSGLAAYFDKETWIFRLGFAAPILLSVIFSNSSLLFGPTVIFGSLTGTFALIYIVLWMVLPIATSDFEKMEMRGEKVDLNSIRENVYAGMGDIKTRAKDWGEEVKETAGRMSTDAASFMNTRGREFAQEVGAAARPIASRGGHIIGTVFRTFFLFIATMIAFGLFVALIGYVFSGMAQFTNDFIFQTTTQKVLSWAVVVLLLGVPLVAIVTYIVRRAIKVKSHNRYLGRTFGALWFAGIICLFCLGGSLAMDFRKYEKVSTEIPIIQPDSGKLVLKVPGRGISYSNSEPWLNGHIDGWDVAGDSIMTAHVQVRADVSPDSQYHVSIHRYSAGGNSREAFDRAQQIAYTARSESDSVLLLDAGYAINSKQKYRRQNVVVEVLVPVGKRLRIDRSVGDKLEGGGFVISEDAVRRNRDWNIEWEDMNEEWDTDIDYVMTASGELVDPLHLPADKQAVAKREADANKRLDSLNRQMDSLQRQKDALEQNN